MKRALAIAVALCTIGVLGFSQIESLTGKWVTKLTVLPTLGLTSTELTLNAKIAGLTFTSVSKITSAGFTSQAFSVKGAFGPFTVSGNMSFDPASVLYLKSDLTTGFDFGGVGVSLKVEHWTPAAYTAAKLTFCSDLGATPTDGVLRYTLEGKLDPITLKVVFADCCTGMEFYQMLVTLKGLGLCCGVTYDAEFSFKKTGFDYLKFSMANFAQICCGISFDATVTFKTNSKTVEIKPKFAGLGDACVKVYGDAIFDGSAWMGIDIYGYAIKCTLGDCNSITFATALPKVQVYDIYACPNQSGDPWPYDVKLYKNTETPCTGGVKLVDDWTYYGVDATFMSDYGLQLYACVKSEYPTGPITICYGYEYETLQMSFCGMSCCGQQYKANVKIYWGDLYCLTWTPTGGWGQIVKVPTLFGLSRFAFDVSVPVMSNFTVDLGLSHVLLKGCVGPSTTLTLGWTFTF